MKKDVVIVDDDFITRVDLREILVANGFEVVAEGEDGITAIELCKIHKPNLVIMDIDMPILDGIKAGKVIIKENLAGGVILLTGFNEKEYINKAQNIGAFGYVIKPIDEKNLIPTIEMCLGRIVEFKKIKKDLDKVNSKLNERKLVEKAKGLLIKELKISEDDAYNKIRKLSMDKRCSMSEIANMFIIAYED